MVSLIGSKALLAFTNFLLLACGCVLITGGSVILLDPGRVLLSRLLSQGPLTTLPHPLLYYLAVGFALAGLILACAGVLGCWASCLYSFCTLTIYFLLVLLVLVAESALYGIAWIWPQCLGLGIVPEELVRVLQANYGVAGQEQFTAAIDLAQTLFSCCGITSGGEYDTSSWRLESLGPRLKVPLTCCKLDNLHHPSAYLDPRPINTSLCQAVEVEQQQGFRHSDGCSLHLEDWFKQQYIIFLIIGLVMVLIEFVVLLSTILACTRLYKHRHNMKNRQQSMEMVEEEAPKRNVGDSIYLSTRSREPFSYSNHAYTMTNSFRRNYHLSEKA
ncbi:PREDICTED: tetraspanin-11 [Nicrophorus vespilloides]|uniref:Tetraspanin-11 n=1 Tax=Nicrophorus vespilloides TaxID=110193 RepID=A0ABM1MS81_NICVS|nr:PREDICTED: tetraspanin-11 [Nicrophorus vespilloides]